MGNVSYKKLGTRKFVLVGYTGDVSLQVRYTQVGTLRFPRTLLCSSLQYSVHTRVGSYNILVICREPT